MNSSPNYDSEFCGKLPIHLINTIQPYGVLLIIDKAGLQVVQASENVEALFGIPAASLIRSDIRDHVDQKTFEQLRRVAASPAADKIPFSWTIHQKEFLALLHVKEHYILAELEAAPFKEEDRRSFVSVYQEIKYSMALVDAAATTTEVCTLAAREIRRISCFDKVMIYRFDEAWNGTVIAEEMEPGMESFYGFTFPASDIPRQARDLYLRNPYRFIPDRNYQPVRLHPVMNPLTRGFIDLSDCNVRGVAAVHLEYLANMEVVASMSTRILHNDRLWGLIACHHRTAKDPSFELCSIFELMSHTISARILSLQNKERHEAFSRAQETYTRLLEKIYEKKDLRKGLFDEDPTILSLFNAAGAAIIRKGEIAGTTGILPERERIEELLFWLHTRKLTRSFHTDHLASHFDRSHTYTDSASGLLAIPIQPGKDEYLLLVRPEQKRTIDWGGDPGGRIVYEKDEKNYHPRHSFKLWRQIVTGTSRPWKQEELAIAETLRIFLHEYTDKQI